jgi:hypothetical protein
MTLRTPRFIAFALVALLLCGGVLIYGMVCGIPQWSVAFHGALQPLIEAYGGWTITLSIVGLGILLVGGSLALGWMRRSFDYLLLAVGFLAVLIFVSLGLPSSISTMVDASVSFLVVGLCALLVVVAFAGAVRERLSRRYHG